MLWREGIPNWVCAAMRSDSNPLKNVPLVY